MDAYTIMRTRPALTEYLHQFDDCMGRGTNRSHLQTYVSGQLSDLERKSVEPIADAAGVAPRTLPEIGGATQKNNHADRCRIEPMTLRSSPYLRPRARDS